MRCVPRRTPAFVILGGGAALPFHEGKRLSMKEHAQGRDNDGGSQMKKVQITETVLRDANQSLMATRLPYADSITIVCALTELSLNKLSPPHDRIHTEDFVMRSTGFFRGPVPRQIKIARSGYHRLFQEQSE